MSDNTYRTDVSRPVCAKCIHRADAKMMDKKEPWRDWFCLATSKVVWREEYNPLTGVTTPAKMGHDRCIVVNADSQCANFEPAPAPAPRPKPSQRRAPPPPPMQPDEPEVEPMSWWRRILRGEG